ncbi:MAG: polysaccharide pyruvyl transferase family protein [Ruminococcaceae bacterium]|nr:polysaccharide pyruvyl transferase family protein [Oscillospiraceae bacterium]
MSKVFLYAHGGSGNHGCEAIVRSTVNILENEDLCLISSRPDEDNLYGLNEICKIIKDRVNFINKLSFGFIKAYASLKFKKDYIPMDKLWYVKAFSNVKKGDIALSIGGDNYCYADVKKYAMLHEMLKKRGAKTVLWGCSVEPKITEESEIAADLARYDLIAARETISYEALKKVNSNTILVSDPAFVLQPKECKLPDGFVSGNTVGLNLSPMAMDLETQKGIAFENYKKLINYLIDKTDMQVALIPHVVWEDGDDRIPLRKLYEEFKDTKRVIMVEDHTCRELKYIISKCRFFIGARTHATIAAYSSCVPTLVLGYSVKSRGIARDLFGSEENYVLPVQNLKCSDELAKGFDWLMKNELKIKEHLKNIMPEYKEKAVIAKDLLSKI